ncbi:MAG TPA: DUF1993 domain-containing protein [Rhizomicrobium sp.]
MYKASVPVFTQFLCALSAVLDKAATFAETKKIDATVLTAMRLAPDMHPLAWQIRSATNHAARACAMLAGVALPELGDNQATISDLKERIAKTVDFVKNIKAEQLDGQEDRDIVLKFGANEFNFTGLSFLLNFSLPNFYFHAATSYDILRHAGVDIGKRDFMGTPPK